MWLCPLMECEAGRERQLGLVLSEPERPSPWSPHPLSVCLAFSLPGVRDPHASSARSRPSDPMGDFWRVFSTGVSTGEGSAPLGRNQEVPLGGQKGRQTSLWSWRAVGASRRSMGVSEAEDWLGREASSPLGDSEGGLYRRQAVAKNRKPST